MNKKKYEYVPTLQTADLLEPCTQHAKYRHLAAIKSLVGGGEAGGALVELGLTLPILFVIITGIFSFSLALYQKLELSQAVGAGARFLAVDRGDLDPCATTAAKVYNAAPSLTQGSMGFTFAMTSGSTTTTYTTPTCSGATMTSGGSASIKVTYPCALQVYGLNLASCSLASQVVEVVQ